MRAKFAENIKNRLGKLSGYGLWILILLLAFSLVRNVENSFRIKAEIATEEGRVKKMEKDNGELEAKIAQTQGADFIEKEIRNKLGLVKEGEAIVVLPDVELLRKLAPSEANEEEVLPDPNWKRWLKLFI